MVAAQKCYEYPNTYRVARLKVCHWKIDIRLIAVPPPCKRLPPPEVYMPILLRLQDIVVALLRLLGGLN